MATHTKTSVKIVLTAIVCLWTATAAADESAQASKSSKPSRETYFESFDHGSGGWGKGRRYPLTIFDGVAYTYGPWWVDANHAPPGAGYLNILLWIYTNRKVMEDSVGWFKSKGFGLPHKSVSENRFITNNQSTDFTNARLTVRMRGDIDLKGTNLYLHLQGSNGKTTANYILKGQPLTVNRDWTEQTVTLTPDPDQWLCIGARHDMTDEYGCFPIDELLSDVSVNIIFVLFPVNVVPVENIPDKHKLRAVADYHVNQEFLPKGVVMCDWVKIEYPE